MVGLIFAVTLGLTQANQANGYVARVSVVEGHAAISHAGGKKSAAIANAPLLPGDTLTTSAGTRAEIQFDSYNLVRLAPNSRLRLTEFGADRQTLQLFSGTAEVRVFSQSAAQPQNGAQSQYGTQPQDGSQSQIVAPQIVAPQIVAPQDVGLPQQGANTQDVTQAQEGAHPQIVTTQLAMLPLEAGVYRVSASDNETRALARTGEAEVAGGEHTERLSAGRTIVANGSDSNEQWSYNAWPAYDDFDRWNADRDTVSSYAGADQYVSGDVAGMTDLERYGQWVNVQPYGQVWSPFVGSGWAPYHNGSWWWTGPQYGWSWVGSEAWGWAPFHYGNWFFQRPFGWLWFPGQFGIASPWAPALVVFFGGKPQPFPFFGFNGIGWMPLAPFFPFANAKAPGAIAGHPSNMHPYFGLRGTSPTMRSNPSFGVSTFGAPVRGIYGPGVRGISGPAMRSAAPGVMQPPIRVPVGGISGPAMRSAVPGLMQPPIRAAQPIRAMPGMMPGSVRALPPMNVTHPAMPPAVRGTQPIIMHPGGRPPAMQQQIIHR
jgi:hypothetical protein